MITNIVDDNGLNLNAKVELHDGTIILHSRGGAFGQPNLRNPDYRQALRLILLRLRAAGHIPTGAWLDSAVARRWPESERLLLTVSEFQQPVETVLSAIAQRGAAKGRPEGSAGHGNSTKRVKLLIPGLSTSELMVTLKAESIESTSLPAATLRMVQQSMIDAAIAAYRAGTEHGFAESTKYDVLLPSGDRLPPKAVFGIALSEIIGRPATPHDFSAGWGTPCFSIIEAAGYPIVEKDEIIPISASEIDDERTWAEGTPRRVAHLRRERAPGLSRAKKRSFIEQHGELSCERCHITAKSLGEYGDACIEVHHARVAVAAMDGNTRTRLSDLICLCANCHRIVHRQEL